MRGLILLVTKKHNNCGQLFLTCVQILSYLGNSSPVQCVLTVRKSKLVSSQLQASLTIVSSLAIVANFFFSSCCAGEGIGEIKTKVSKQL